MSPKSSQSQHQKGGTAPDIETEEDGKLSRAQAEAIMSADLPSGDPELTAPIPAADRSPDHASQSPEKERARKKRAA